jgi:membrane-associated phospholipid phosphatase
MAILTVSFVPLERDRISTTERSVFQTFNQLPDALNVVVVPVMQLGDFLAIPGLALGAFFITGRRRIAIDLALSASLAWILSTSVKAIVERGRPGDLLTELTLRGHQESGYGFISGHSAVAAALATVAAAYLPAKGKLLVAFVAAVVAMGRMYVGAHLPLDVVGGLAMGWAIGSLVHLLILPEDMGDKDTEPTGVKLHNDP